MIKVDPKYNIVLNKVTLNFLNAKLEEQFRKNYFKKSLFILRISVFTTILLYASFGLLDSMTSPDYKGEFLFVRFLIVIPVLSLFIGISFLKSFRKFWHPLIALMIIVAGSGIIYMVHRDPDNLYYYGGLFLIFMGGYFFLKVRFFVASITGLVVVIIYNIAYFIIPITSSSAFDNVMVANAFFLSSNIICMIGLYNIERLERIDFYQQRLLADKQVEIENVNAGLETTIKQRTKDLIIAKNKAEESERLKSAFLANMSHEIRTPMNGILGFSDLLKDPKLTGEEQLRFISIIEKSGARMLSTVNDIVEISKIESGQMELHMSTVDLVDEITALYEFFKPEAASKKLRLILDVKLHGNDRFVLTDQTKFNSVLTNLIKNAIKYTDEGYVEIRCGKKEGFIELSILDSGIGIPPDRILAVFNRFEQADISDRNARQGSGLGLAISKSYIEMLGGEISVVSNQNGENGDGRGSVFTFTLPFVQQEIMEELESEKSDLNLNLKGEKKFKILIVEDDTTSTQYLNALLHDVVDNLIFAKTGKEAVMLVQADDGIDLVLMDIKMPVMNGFVATQLIKEIRPDLPVIATTAYSYPEDRKNAKDVGCDGFITKPINKNELFKLLEKFLLIKLT